jgi:septum formation protein
MSDRPRIVLASQSPRRRALLEHLGLPHEVIAPDVDEESLCVKDPRALATQLAFLKATEVAERLEPPAIVIGADTVVALGGEVFGKPKDAVDAERMLRALRGETHSVITGLAVATVGEGCELCSETTQVTMRRFSDAELRGYVRSGEPMDKAGAYAIQGLGAALIEGHTGCWCNVVGLPLIALLGLLSGAVDVAAHPISCTCVPWPHHREGALPWETLNGDS